MPQKKPCANRAAAAGTRSGGRPSAGRRAHRGPFLGGDRSRGIKLSTLPRRRVCCRALVSGGPRGWRDAVSHARAGGWALSVLHRAGGDRGPARSSLWVREIARQLGRAPSTISRELQRNAAIRTGRPEYRASTAQTHADRRARRPKPAAASPADRRSQQPENEEQPGAHGCWRRRRS